jgi:hypothetical protein
MLQTYEKDGISFRYPAQWKLEQEESDNGWTVLLQSTGTAFVTITLDTDMPSLEEVLETALKTLRSDYPTLEAEPCVETVAGQLAMGHTIQFFALDLTTTCYTRCFHCEQGTVLVLCQADDQELEECEPVFRAILASLRVEE